MAEVKQIKEAFDMMESRVTELCKEQEESNAALTKKDSDTPSKATSNTKPNDPDFPPFSPKATTDENGDQAPPSTSESKSPEKTED